MTKTKKTLGPPTPLTVVDDSPEGTYSRLADEVRRNMQNFVHLKIVTVSHHLPPWRREKDVVKDKELKGLTGILSYDKKSFRELWYKVSTRGHRSKIFIR